MNRTPPVLAAVTCAAAFVTGLAATPDIASAGPRYGDSRQVDYYADELRRAESDFRAARGALHRAEQDRRHAEKALADARCELDEAQQISRRDRDRLRLLDNLRDAEQALAEHERRLGVLIRDCEAAERDVERAKDAFYDGARRSNAFRDLDRRHADAKRRYDDAVRDVVRDLERSYDYRALVSYRDEAAERYERVQHRGHAPDYIADRARRDLEAAERDVARLRDDAIARSPCASNAASDLAAAQRDLDRFWDRVKRDLASDRNYRRAQDRVRDLLAAKAEAGRCIEQANRDVVALRRDLDRLGGSYVSLVDLRPLERAVRVAADRLAAADEALACAVRDADAARRRLARAQDDYDRAVAGPACGSGDRGDRYRSRDRGRGNRYPR